LSLFRLAGHLHKTVGEIEQMPLTEFFEWCAFFRIEEENRKT